MKIKNIFEGRVKNAWMDGTYQSTPTPPSEKPYTLLAYVYGQYYHITRTAKTVDQAGTYFLRALQRKLGMYSLTKKDCRIVPITDATTIPRTSVDLDRI